MAFKRYSLNVPNPWDASPAVPMPSPVPPMVPSSDIQLIEPINAPQPASFDTVEYGLRPWPSTTEPTIAGLGQEKPLDLIGMMRDMHEGYLDLAPTIDFWGNHPVMSLTLLMAAIIVGGAVGGYIGAGYKAEKRR